MSPIPLEDGSGRLEPAQAGASAPETAYADPQDQDRGPNAPLQADHQPAATNTLSEVETGQLRPVQDVSGQPEPAQETEKPAPEKRYTLTIEAAAEIYDQNDVPRDLSTIRKYCRQAKIEAARLPDENGAWFITEISVHRHARKLKDELWIAREREAQTKAQSSSPVENLKNKETTDTDEIEPIGQTPTTAHIPSRGNIIKVAKMEVTIESLKERLLEKDHERERQKEIYEAQLDRNERTLQIAYRENGELKMLLAKAGIQVGQLTVNNHPDQNPLPGLNLSSAEDADFKLT